MKAFEDGRTIIELAGLFMVVLPVMLYAVLQMKINFSLVRKDGSIKKTK